MNPPTLKELCARAVPGPWTMRPNWPPRDKSIVLVTGVTVNHEAQVANVQLIARIASPEVALAVYEALELADEPYKNIQTVSLEADTKRLHSDFPFRAHLARCAYAVRRALELLDGKITL